MLLSTWNSKVSQLKTLNSLLIFILFLCCYLIKLTAMFIWYRNRQIVFLRFTHEWTTKTQLKHILGFDIL